MTTTDGSIRTDERDEHSGEGRTPGGGDGRSSRRLARALAGLAVALGISAVAACSSGSPVPASGNGTVPVTSTASGPPSTSSPSGAGGTTTSSSPSPTSSTGGGEAPGTPTTGGLAPCAPGQMRVTVMGAPGGGSAGHQEMQVIATNTGPTQCTLQGYPGVSLTAPGSGAQLGASADRVAGDSPLMRLEPGKTAVSSILVAQAGLYANCGATTAAGFRVYLPGQTTAIFAPFQISACRSASVHQLSVKPFTT